MTPEESKKWFENVPALVCGIEKTETVLTWFETHTEWMYQAFTARLESEGRLLPRDMTVEEYAEWKGRMVK